MKRTFFVLGLTLLMSGSLLAQRFAMVDTEYILDNIPSYRAAQQTLDELSAEWQEEVEEKQEEVEKLFKEYQAERVLLTEEMRQKREQDIVSREQKIRELQRTYFGPEGSLFEKRQELIEPIQEEVYQAINKVAEDGNFAVIFDSSAGLSMVYSDPRHDKSDEVLQVLGYK